MKSCSARCRSCVVVDIVIGIGREDSTKSLHGNDNTTFLIEADDGICKISLYCPQTRVGDAQSTSMHDINQAFHYIIGIYFDGYTYITSGFSRVRIWRGIQKGLVDRCFTELYKMSCDIDSAAAGTCSEAVDTRAGDSIFSFMIPGPSSTIWLEREQYGWH